MNTVFLRLEAPLQAWGLRAHWEERDTASEPTKSGVIGLVGCALGLPRSSGRLRELSDGVRLGVRVDRPGARLTDYHTTGGGLYQDAGGRQRSRFHTDDYMGGVLSAEVSNDGSIYVKINETTKLPETDVSYRHYLMDAVFVAALQGDPALIAEVAAALQAPVFPVFLGRKACVPSAPIFAGTGDYPDLEHALRDWTADTLHGLSARRDPDGQLIRMVVESVPGQGIRHYDAIGVPGQRTFLPRYVRESYVPRPPSESSMINTLEG